MIEENIIGLCIRGELEPSETGLIDDHFLQRHNKLIWQTLTKIRLNKLTCDIITTTDELQKINNSYDWYTILNAMASSSTSAYTAKSHALKIKDSWRKNRLKEIGDQMLNSDNADINFYIKELMSLSDVQKKYLYTMAEAADDALDEIDKIQNGERVTIPSGLADIDKNMGGLHNSDLIIVAARPAMGKTAFMLNMAAANEDSPLVFSTEQSRIQAANRLFSIYGSVEGHKLRTGEISDQEYAQITVAINKINNCNGMIYDKSGPLMSEIESVARKVKAERGCNAIYLDYLQRIKHENPSLPKHEQVGDIAMRLKELARELDVPVVALAQVSRKCEDRTDKRPQMGDIKDSGTVEQEADSILTLYRDEVYNDDSPDRGICEIDFKKNRHGGTGVVRAAWIPKTMQFKNLTEMRY